jgi:hypothetical protein
MYIHNSIPCMQLEECIPMQDQVEALLYDAAYIDRTNYLEVLRVITVII